MNLWIQCLEIQKWRNQHGRSKIKFKYKRGWIRYLRVPDITDYKLGFITQKFKIINPIWRTEIIRIYLDEIQYTEVFAVADAKAREIVV